MELINKILEHSDYIRYLKLNSKAEKKRKYCRHDLQHALDVARVAYIISLENGYHLSKEMIYAAALLHDIAKWKQYKYKLDHGMEGALMAEEILEDIGAEDKDIKLITDAIRTHRTKGAHTSNLGMVLYTGDKSCRPCIRCSMLMECNGFMGGKPSELRY